MRRPRPIVPEIAGRLHDPTAEMMLPDAIGDDPRRERIGGVGDAFGEFQTAAAFREGLGIAGAQDRGQMARGNFTAIVDVAANGYTDVARVGVVLDGLQKWILGWERLFQVGGLLAKRLEPVFPFAAQETVDLHG